LAVYTGANHIYDPVGGQRTEPAYWDISVGLIVHIDYRDGRGTCNVYELDMDAYTGALLLAREVEEWRKTARLHATHITTPYTVPAPSIEDRIKAKKTGRISAVAAE
jgi:hypothetical protein